MTSPSPNHCRSPSPLPRLQLVITLLGPLVGATRAILFGHQTKGVIFCWTIRKCFIKDVILKPNLIEYVGVSRICREEVEETAGMKIQRQVYQYQTQPRTFGISKQNGWSIRTEGTDGTEWKLDCEGDSKSYKSCCQGWTSLCT